MPHSPVKVRHFAANWVGYGPEWKRVKHRRRGGAVMRLVRYADDFVVMVAGTRADAETLWGEVAAVLAPMGLRLSVDKTRVVHVDDGFDFLGWHIQRRSWRGRPGKKAVYTYPSKKALASIIDKVRTLTRRAKHRTLADLLRRLNPVLRGWCTYFRHGVSARTFSYLDHYAFWRIIGWLRKRHVGLNMHTLVRRFLPVGTSAPRASRCSARTRSPWSATDTAASRSPPHGRCRQCPLPRRDHVESRMRWKSHVRFGGRAGETHQPKG